MRQNELEFHLYYIARVMEITGKKHVRLSKFNAIRRAVDTVVDCQLMGFFNLT